MATAAAPEVKTMHTLPGDAVRQIQWRFADRFDLQMLVQSARTVARTTVAQMVAAGERNTHEWTPAKAEMMEAFDRAGITAAFMEPEEGGFIAGPKNLALSLAAFELAWVDGGAATGSLASFLALAPIHECGTAEQITHYKTLAAPSQTADGRKPWRGAFALTEPLPYVGVDTGILSGKLRIAEWKDGAEPMLQVDKRGRFITNIAFANFVTAHQGQLRGDSGGGRRGHLRPWNGDQEAGAPALVHRRPDLQPEGPGQPHHRRIHGAGRRDRAQLQPRRGDRGGLPPDARHGGPDDGGQAAVGGRAGDPLSAPSSSARTRCTGWWTCGPWARPPRRWDLPRRGSSTSWSRWRSRRTR
jgi:hypothetical protein